MRELNETQLQDVSGGWVVPAFKVIMGTGAYLQSLKGFNSFGRNLGIGFYNGLHKSR